MEDSGYMARAAFIVDKLMHKIGLHGKSFIPMVMGFGCNVPAIMATRAIESRKSRLITIAIIPFMSCAGRLPIFVLFAGAFFPAHPATALLGIYLLGIVMAILSALVIGKFIKEDDLPFVMELPPYRVPTARAIGRHTWEKGRQYLEKMATTILIFSVAIWFLGYFPRHEGSTDAYQQEHSYIGMVGKSVEPAMEPLGFNWKMDVGLLTGIGAKELVISSLGVMYAQDGAASEADEGDTALQAALKADIPIAAALAYMVFVLLYFPCIATFVATKNETGSWWWAILLCLYTIFVAWLCVFAAYRIGLLIWPV
jgi:ferrous iron transport protein B